MSITAARLQAEVGADTKGFDSGMAHADRTIKAAPGKWATALKVGAGAALAVGGAFVVRGMVGAIRSGLDSLTEQGVVVAQTNAAIRSTKGAANVSATAIRDLSTALEAKSGFDDKAIQSGANLLLTFTNIKNAAGDGNNIFDQSTEVLTNMARAMGTDVKSGAIKLGRALQDPLKGVTALTRVGVTFDETQKKQIATMVKAGDTMGAQKIILAELNKEFGKSNEEFMKTDAGQALLFADAIENVQQKLAGALLPALTRVRGALTGFLGKPETLAQAAALGDAIGAIFSPGNLSMAANLMTTAAGAIGTAIKLFSALPPEVQALAVGALALKKITGIGPTDIVKTALGGLDLFKRGGTPANPLFVADVAGGLGGKTPGVGALPAAGLLATWLPVAAGAAAIAGLYWLGQQNQSQPNPVPDSNLIAAQAWGGVSPTDPNSAIRQWNERGGLGGSSGGRGDASTAAEVKRLGERQALAARIVAAGGVATAARITAIMEKNVRATQSGDDRTAARLSSINVAVNRTTDAALATAAAIRAKQFTAYAQFKSTVLNNPDLNGPKPKPVQVVLSPRAVPNATRATDLYGPTSPRNGRVVPVAS